MCYSSDEMSVLIVVALLYRRFELRALPARYLTFDICHLDGKITHPTTYCKYPHHMNKYINSDMMSLLTVLDVIAYWFDGFPIQST